MPVSETPDIPNLSSLREAAERATPGPWTIGQVRNTEFSSPIATPEATFIAAANPSTVLALLSRLEATERVVEAARELRDSSTVHYADSKRYNVEFPKDTVDDFAAALAALDGTAP
jgi:Ead/Ea22-like protein